MKLKTKVKRPARLKFDSPTSSEIEDLCYKLAKKIKKSRFVFDVIVAIGRGGWIPARYLADYLGNIVNMASVKVEHYVGINKRAKAEITQEVNTNVRGKNILLVDDVSDSGDSLIIAKRHLIKRGARSVKIATLHHKPWSAIRPDFFVKETKCWVIYPWMCKENLEELKRSGKDLKKTHIPQKTIKKLLRI